MWIINVQYHPFLIRRVDVVYSTDDAMTSTDDTTDVTSSAATSVAYLELKSERSLGPDGMPSDDCAARWDDDINITSRRTHALLIGVLCLFYWDLGHQQRPMANPMSNDIIIPPSPCIGSIYHHQTIVNSGFIPSVQRHPNRRKDTFNNVTDEDESSGSGDESEVCFRRLVQFT